MTRTGTGHLNVWEDDDDAFLASWEDLVAGGHGTWYTRSVEVGYFDELSQAYRDIDAQLNLRNHIAIGRTSEGQGEDEEESNGESN